MADDLAIDDETILSRRGARNPLDPTHSYGVFVEQELSADGRINDVLVVLLTNRECPFRCVFCDLWVNTLAAAGPPGSVTTQVEAALNMYPQTRRIKLYNAGSFFDERAITAPERQAILTLVRDFDEVIVESHPAFVDDRVNRARSLVRGEFEVAMGLETSDEIVLSRLNKKMTLADYERACSRLKQAGVHIRSFVMFGLPGHAAHRAIDAAKNSLTFAFDHSARVCTILPVRANSGWMAELKKKGQWSPPDLEGVLETLEWGVSQGRGRVFADLWDFPAVDDERSARRVARVQQLNTTQRCNRVS